MKGAYVLLFSLPEKHIAVGKLGTIHFAKGNYAYVGSAMNSLENRISRHFSKNKKLHWHIDYVLLHANILKTYTFPSESREECNIAKNLASKFPGIKGFGCSDCKCESHLFFIGPSKIKSADFNYIFSSGKPL